MIKALAAGLLISIGCKVNASVGGVFGALLFSLALLCIIQYKLYLFTGKVGYNTKVFLLLKILAFNIIGAFIGGYIFNAMWCVTEAHVRCTDTIYNILFKSIGCGALMYLAVDAGNKLVTIFSVAVFILCGFEHCVADAAYIGLHIIEYPWFLPLVIIGNTIGAKMIHFMVGENGYREKFKATDRRNERNKCKKLAGGDRKV